LVVDSTLASPVDAVDVVGNSISNVVGVIIDVVTVVTVLWAVVAVVVVVVVVAVVVEVSVGSSQRRLKWPVPTPTNPGGQVRRHCPSQRWAAL